MNDPTSQRLSSGETAYQTLIGSLRDGRYRPGDRLREEEVAERLALSRTPVREAIRRLEADGIIEHRPRIGAIIRSLDYTEVVQLYEMRLVLERTAAAMAAQHGTEAEFDTLASLNDDIAAEPANAVQAASINQTFHQALHNAGRNRFLLDAARALNNSLLLLGPTTYTDANRVAVVVDQHSAIIAALRARDAAVAAAAAQEHLETSLRHRLRALSK